MNMFNKDNLRQKAKEIRKTLDIKNISRQIVENIRKSDVYKQAKHVMLFYPKKDEVDLRDLLGDGKLFYLPRVNGDELEVCRYGLGDDLVMSDFKVLEPLGECVNKSVVDLVFVPALCVDEQCNRLGYGKGYYDRFLKNYLGESVVVVPFELVFDCICIEENDIPCKKIITQKKASFDRG